MPRAVFAQFGIALTLLGWTLAAWAVDVNGVRVWADPEKTRAVLDLSGTTEYSLFTLEGPDRVVIDLPNASMHGTLQTPDARRGVISRIRHGRPDAQTLRLVFDLAGPGDTRSFLLKPTGEYGHRLVIDLFPESSAPVREVKRASAPPVVDRDVVIAIDAGHGGEDPGAIGANRTREKDIVLQISRQLKKTIDAEPGMRAVLTRDGDYYIAHRERYERARRERADLFLSIHADAFRDRSVAGSSVFVLSQRGASSEFARLVADSENRSDLVGGVSLNDKDDMLATVLLDLSQSATMKASDAVAGEILASLKRSVKTHKPHVGRANFLVLKSPDVPSVLIETAFISNPSEEKRLGHRDFQQDISRAITDGVRRYFYSSPPPGTWIARHRAGTRHVVSRGDTLGGIASQYRVSLASLREANGIAGDVIRPGTELLIPRG